jgi:hypothetical protein
MANPNITRSRRRADHPARRSLRSLFTYVPLAMAWGETALVSSIFMSSPPLPAPLIRRGSLRGFANQSKLFSVSYGNLRRKSTDRV